MPCEISIADELPEFKRSVLETRRQPLEEGHSGGPAARKSSRAKFRGNSDLCKPEAKASAWLTRDGERLGEDCFPSILTFILTFRLERECNRKERYKQRGLVGLERVKGIES